MNKKLFLAALATTALATSCVDEGIGESNVLQNSDGRISFVQKVGNMTRGTSQAQSAGHYEFGVFATKGSEEKTFELTSNGVMDNYLVAYTNGSDDAYKDIKQYATTYGNAANGNLTDAATGLSSWFYEGISSESGHHTSYTFPHTTQILKYWDQATSNHYFYAYTPYSGATGATYNPTSVAFSYGSPDNAKLTYTGLSSFYANPETGHQVSTAVTKSSDILNYNEALYAFTNVAKAQYGEDVPLEFKHINAKIEIGFYEVINGYKVHIVDVKTANDGIQFTPATKGNTAWDLSKPSPVDGAYYEKATVAVKDLSGTPAIVVGETTDTKAQLTTNNLVFSDDNMGTNSSITGYTSTKVISETGGAGNVTKSSTVYYALPNKGVIASSGSGSAGEVVGNTGYTLHVSYEIIPEDGTAKTTVYDARVYVAPEYVQWVAGKHYLYMFKITDKSNGTTDPNDPYIDVTDPRIPDDPALVPIVFDGVMVTDYDDVNTGKENQTDEWIITDIASWKAYGSTNFVSPAALTGADLTTLLSTTWTTVTPTTAFSGTNTFNGATRKFTLTDGTNTVEWPATVQEVASPTFSATYNSTDITSLVSAPTWYSYSLYVWDQDAHTRATKYTAEPTGAVVYNTKTEVAKMKNSSDEILYKKSVEENGGAATDTWYTDEACTAAYSGSEHSTYTTKESSTITYTNPTITYGAVSHATASPVPTKAYAIVKVKP